MPDAARKWLEVAEPQIERMLKTFLRFPTRMFWGDALDNISRLLAECERLATESMLWERDWGRAEADRRALVAYVRALYDIQGKNIFGRETMVYDAWQALGAELQELLDGG